ncbi:MAG: oxidoreductase [Geodermatophilaceae bacterium]
MGLFGRKKKGGGPGGGAGAHLLQFAKARQGVEAYVEEMTAGGATVTLVASDGEWTRRNVPNSQVVRKFGTQLGITVHDAGTDGYPDNMREKSVEDVARPT